ncbi:M56 family metallopeptidase [Lentzea sp. NPDC003310]|uniref:M56 family metallopeptidase n=1 Tax=Lentzea sp. NPDC003310 TaxID=3154447 RepID=UPI0033A100C0
MTVAVALLLGALTVAWTGPRMLDRLLVLRAPAGALLTGWLMMVAGCLTTVTAAVVIAVLPGHGPAPLLVGLVHQCWQTLKHGGSPRTEEIAGLLFAAILLGVVVKLALSLVRHHRSQGRLQRKQRDALNFVAQEQPGAIPTWWIPHDRPLAYSLAGRPALIVATDGLNQHLSEASVAAVIEHERAHILGHHHLLVGFAKALASAVPWTPLTRRSPELVAALVELAADATAARMHGADAVRSALVTMTGGATPPTALAMAGDCVELRLRNLGGPQFSGARTWFAGAAAMALPMVVGTALLAVAAFALCPLILPL